MSTQHKHVRLSIETVKHIKEHVHAVDSNADVFIFGSRADLAKKGGDIDILILSTRFALKDEFNLRNSLHNLIGEQKIDIVYAKDKSSNPFVKVALAKAVKL